MRSTARGGHYDDVRGGAQNFCHIVNDADPVEVRISKQWEMNGTGGDLIDTRYTLTLYCEAQITDGEQSCPNGEGSYASCKVFEGDGSEVFVAQVRLEYPSSHCWVVERVYTDAVEIDNDCDDLVISAGNGDSCVITNTVFFEGVPTLSRYGLAVLVLLLLGVAAIGFRRFV